jgi:alpha-mannosidase
VIEWKTANANLKATFPLTAANAKATYNWDIGTIERGNNDERKFEVPSHQWFDLTDRSGTFGVTILSDCKYGSDKPDDKTLRLTLCARRDRATRRLRRSINTGLGTTRDRLRSRVTRRRLSSCTD